MKRLNIYKSPEYKEKFRKIIQENTPEYIIVKLAEQIHKYY